MSAENQMQVGRYLFSVTTASFRYITESISGPGWDFDFIGHCQNDDPEAPLFDCGAQLYTEAAPIPLEKAEDLTGVTLVLPLPYDEETGEPYFGLKLWEEHEVSDLQLRFLRKYDSLYLIEITAKVAASVLGQPEPLTLLAWAEQQPDNAYPL